MRGSSARLNAVTLRAPSALTACGSADGWNTATSAVPSRQSCTSAVEGGCTLRTTSLWANTSAAAATTLAPAATYASSGNDAPAPAPRSTWMVKPAFTSRPATSGDKATRRSLAAVSFGTPTFIHSPRCWVLVPPGGRGNKLTRRVRRRQPVLLPLPREHPLREVQPLGQLAHLGLKPEEAVLEVRDPPLTWHAARGVRNLPARHASPLAVAKFPHGEHHDVVQVPDTEPAQREAHPDAARCAAGVEAMQPEDAAHDAQAQRDAAGALGDGRRFVAHWITASVSISTRPPP